MVREAGKRREVAPDDGRNMTALQLVNQWQRDGYIDPRLYELLIRRLTYRPFSPYSTSITGISAERFQRMIESGKISKVRGIGENRLAQLRRLVKPHHAALYVDAEQMMRLADVRPTEL